MQSNQAPAPQVDSPVMCGRCGAANRVGAAFCTQCGRRLAVSVEAPWGAGDIVLALGALILLLLIVALVARGLRVEDPLGILVLSAGLELALMGVVWVFAKRRYRLSWSALGFRTTGGASKMAMPVVIMLASVATVALYALVLRALGHEDALPKTPFFEDRTRPDVLVGAALLAIVLAPLAEELFFRGFVFGGLMRGLGPWGAAIVSAGLFMLAHRSPVTFIPIFIIGLLLAWAYLKSGSLWYPILAHMGYNSLVVYATLR